MHNPGLFLMLGVVINEAGTLPIKPKPAVQQLIFLFYFFPYPISIPLGIGSPSAGAGCSWGEYLAPRPFAHSEQVG